MLFQLGVTFFSVDKGAANTDEFTILNQIRHQPELITFDFLNMLKIIVYFFFHKFTILSFRYSKLILSLVTFLLTVIILIPSLKKKYALSSFKVLLITYCIFSGFLLNVFYRSLHYNDLMDCLSIWCLLSLLLIIEKEIGFFPMLLMTLLYVGATFFLSGIKFSLGIFSVTVFLAVLFRFSQLRMFYKLTITLIFLILFSLVVMSYIKNFYLSFSGWMQSITIIGKIYYLGDFPVYAIDVVAFLIIIVVLYFYHKGKMAFLNKMVNSITWEKFIVIIFVIQFLLLISLTKNKVPYVLFYMVPSVMFICLGMFLYSLILKEGKYSKVFSGDNSMLLILLASIYFFLVLFGSLSLQLVNIFLHPSFLILLLLLLILYTARERYIYFLSAAIVIYFCFFNLLNPFLYSNKTLFAQNKLYHFKNTGENIFLDKDSYNYLSGVNHFLDSIETTTVINIDYSNVLYDSKQKPYLLSCYVDEQSPDFFSTEIQLLQKDKNIQQPGLLLISSPVDSGFIKSIARDCNLKKGRLLMTMKDPSANVFKFLKSDGNLYIYELVSLK